jgi:hypothetical protein
MRNHTVTRLTCQVFRKNGNQVARTRLRRRRCYWRTRHKAQTASAEVAWSMTAANSFAASAMQLTRLITLERLINGGLWLAGGSQDRYRRELLLIHRGRDDVRVEGDHEIRIFRWMLQRPFP